MTPLVLVFMTTNTFFVSVFSTVTTHVMRTMNYDPGGNGAEAVSPELETSIDERMEAPQHDFPAHLTETVALQSPGRGGNEVTDNTGLPKHLQRREDDPKTASAKGLDKEEAFTKWQEWSNVDASQFTRHQQPLFLGISSLLILLMCTCASKTTIDQASSTRMDSDEMIKAKMLLKQAMEVHEAKHNSATSFSAAD